MEPSLGLVVHYALDDADVAAIRKRRRTVNIAASGAPVHAGELVALMVTSVWPEQLDDGTTSWRVNGQALLDGNDSHWVTMAAAGATPGCWHWPARVGGS